METEVNKCIEVLGNGGLILYPTDEIKDHVDCMLYK